MKLNAKKSAEYFQGIQDYNYKSPYIKRENYYSVQRECTINWKIEIMKIGSRCVSYYIKYKVEDGGMGVQLCKCDSVANSSVFTIGLINPASTENFFFEF